jgi:hypothetical protein
MATSTLPLSNLVDVTVQIQPQAVAPPEFNQALIVGTSSTIPSYGPGGRVVAFSGGNTILAQMIAYGFSPNSPEYLAAQQFLNASSNPYFLSIGRQDLTAINGFSIDVAGTGYALGDLVYITSVPDSIFKVSAESGGIPSALTVVQQGTGATVASGLATTSSGSGTGLTISVSSLGETCLQAVQACRIVNPSWYLVTATAAADGDNIALTEWAQTATPVCQVFWQTSSTSALNGTPGNIFSTLKAGNYNRYQGVYTTVQTVATTTISTINGSPNITLTSATGVVAGQGVVGAGIPLGATLLSIVGTAGVMSVNATATASGVSTAFNNAPNNTYMAAGLMGLAMGLNTGFNNSYFTLTNKNLIGMVIEPITQLQYNTIGSNYGNVYGNFGGSFNSYQTGITGSGQYFDNILGLDMLVADIQFAGANALAMYNAVGQNDSGQAVLIHAENVDGCGPSVARGFLSPGIWTGKTIQFGSGSGATIALQAGNSLPNGFLNVSPSYSQIPTPAFRASAPIYCAVIQTNAVQQIIIAVQVQQ